MASTIRLRCGRTIGPEHSVLIVAELGQNHNGSVDQARALIDAAAWAGADAVKFTKRDLDCELSGEARDRPYLVRHAFGATYGEHRRALELSVEDYAGLARHARDFGLLLVATSCDIPSAVAMNTLPLDALKIASRDLNNLPLVEHLAGLGKPLLVSTGMSGLGEVDRCVDVLQRARAEYALLQCTSVYPTPYNQVHLRSMNRLAERYECPVGFSDHTLGTHVSVAAVARGASVIEKHLTLDCGAKGSDHACSLEPEAMRQLVEQIRDVESALGSCDKPVPADVVPVRAKLGRSLVTRVPLAAGTRIEEPMLVLKSPGHGIGWLDRQQVVGRIVKRDVCADEVLTIDDVM